MNAHRRLYNASEHSCISFLSSITKGESCYGVWVLQKVLCGLYPVFPLFFRQRKPALLEQDGDDRQQLTAQHGVDRFALRRRQHELHAVVLDLFPLLFGKRAEPLQEHRLQQRHRLQCRFDHRRCFNDMEKQRDGCFFLFHPQ